MTTAVASTSWWVYMVRTGQGWLYTGITTDVARRVAQHRAGKGAKALRGKGPLQLVYCEQATDKGAALRREYALKQHTKQQKEQLVQRYQLTIASHTASPLTSP